MVTRISKRDWETLSAYVDGQLSPRERAHLESRLQSDSELQSMLEDLRRTQAILRSLPKMRTPRNYTLTPQMVPVKHERSRAFPVLSLASALATLLLVLVLVGDFFAPRQLAMAPVVETQVVEAPAQAEPRLPGPQFGMGGGEDVQPEMEGEEIEKAMEVAPGPTPTVQPSPQPGPYPAEEPVEEEPPMAMMQEAQVTPPPSETRVEPYPAPQAKDQVELLPTPEAEIVPTTALGRNLIFRILEIGLAFVAVATGLAAFLLRRGAGG